MRKLIQLITAAPSNLAEAFQQPALRNPIAISFGAIAGALSRYYLGLWLSQRLGSSFPYATLLINLSGSFVMGVFVTLVLERSIVVSPEVRLLVAVGFLGSYTTFSSYKLDTILLMREQSFLLAGVYWLGSAVFGVLSLYLGILFARWIG